MLDFLKKTIKFIKNMITQDSIATAQIAQIFGSELLRVQQSVSDSQTQPDIVKMNPKQFLVGQQNFNANRRLEEQQLIQKLSMEAEMAYPLPQSFSPPPVEHPTVFSSPQPSPQIVVAPSSTAQQHQDVLNLIAGFLERIVIKLESVDLKPKRKTMKRKSKNKKLTLLNENNV
jgi:hypothetical protein